MRREVKFYTKQLREEAFKRRLEARRILFTVGGGMLRNLNDEDRLFVKRVAEEGYQAYLHTFRTGVDDRYPGSWEGRQQLTNIHKRALPISRRKYWVVWYGSQKARWKRFDVPRSIKEALDARTNS